MAERSAGRSEELPLVASRLLWLLLGVAIGLGGATAIVVLMQ